MMHSRRFETFVYVLVTHVIFQHIINNVQKQCSKATPKVSGKLEKHFPT
jgi:hypothetical protein